MPSTDSISLTRNQIRDLNRIMTEYDQISNFNVETTDSGIVILFKDLDQRVITKISIRNET